MSSLNYSQSNLVKLKRLVLASMLFEDQFYMDGQTNAKLLKDLVPKVSPADVASLAIEARTKYKLRHVPLFLARELARTGKLSADTLNAVIQRPDEMGEFLAHYWSEGKSPLSNQVKKGLAKAFIKFNEYQLAKWDKNSAAVKMRDVMFLSHAKPTSPEQAELFKRVANKQLETPDTWETELSAGADKRATFERLMLENKLGALAFLRNLRNMQQAGVSDMLIKSYGSQVNVSNVLPFRYIAAARNVPMFQPMLEQMMLRSLASMEKLPGKTILLVDVSGSMFGQKISEKSDLERFDAAAALAMLCASICENVEIYTFSRNLVRVPTLSGFSLVNALRESQGHGGTALGASLSQLPYSASDRIIVFTDEQSSDRPGAPGSIGARVGYIVNVASYERGISNTAWTQVNGFSEAVIDYIRESEKS